MHFLWSSLNPLYVKHFQLPSCMNCAISLNLLCIETACEIACSVKINTSIINELLTSLSDSTRTWSYSLRATRNMMDVTFSKQWIHFLRSDLWPPTSTILKESKRLYYWFVTDIICIHNSCLYCTVCKPSVMHGALRPIIIIIIITTFILPGKKHIEIKNLFYKCVPAEINSNSSRGFNK